MVGGLGNFLSRCLGRLHAANRWRAGRRGSDGLRERAGVVLGLGFRLPAIVAAAASTAARFALPAGFSGLARAVTRSIAGAAEIRLAVAVAAAGSGGALAFAISLSGRLGRLTDRNATI